jgi:hypothetical protein
MEHRVSFRWNDYAADSKQKVMTVSTDEFLRRFLIHDLPKGVTFRAMWWAFFSAN